MQTQKYKNNLESKILLLTQKILHLKIGLIEGCKAMTPLLQEKGIDLKKDFLVFTVVNSETEHLPIEATRKYWAKELIKTQDKEIKEFEKFYQKQVLTACKKIMKYISKIK